MQDYTDFAKKNGTILLNEGSCQLCGAQTERGIHECVEIFSVGFPQIDYSTSENHLYRFLSVDAHTLQHSEIHGRWNNHFHLTRLHLIFSYDVKWAYQLSPKLSDHLNQYKRNHSDEYLISPVPLNRGILNVAEVLSRSKSEVECKKMITDWAKEVYTIWSKYHSTVDTIANSFIKNSL